MTLRTAMARFLTQLEADGKSPLTISVYRRELERFGKWLGTSTDVRRARPDALARYLTDPAQQVTPSGTKRNARTMNRRRTVLRLLFGPGSGRRRYRVSARSSHVARPDIA